MPRRSINESTAPVRVAPTSRASTRSLGSFTSARYMRMPVKTPQTARPISRASRRAIDPVPSSRSDVDPRQAADQDEADGVQAERDDHRRLAERGAGHPVQGAALLPAH